MRDVQADMKAALIDEYESYVRAGREADAAHVAEALKYYGYDVAKPDGETVTASAPERADAEKPPEAAVEPKPRRGGRPKLPRDGEGNIVRDKAVE